MLKLSCKCNYNKMIANILMLRNLKKLTLKHLMLLFKCLKSISEKSKEVKSLMNNSFLNKYSTM